MFGKRKNNQEEFEKQLLDNQIKLKEQESSLMKMLSREIGQARQLKEQGLKSPSNYSRIGIVFYLLQAVKKAMERLNSVRDNGELNQIMGDLGGLLGNINEIGTQTAKPKLGNLISGITKMRTAEKEENEGLAGLLKGLAGSVAQTSDIDISNLVGLGTIERLINGDLTAVSGLPADVVPIQEEVKSQKVMPQTVESMSQMAKKSANTVSEAQTERYDDDATVKLIQDMVKRL